MTKWEYTTCTPGELAARGEQGWELVTVIVQDGQAVCYLKRPLPSLSERITLEQRRAYVGGEPAR
ncbi:hypothetical protein GCM10010885_09350 [Alicyclobacillus cellulosilyticus]|uniref:DUF4177 domain-containing protein n=1 Tax=Alicyclobacillus cellulosilyticus TaxID=1003997 RepID=A0A917K8P3_9BACL|nr:hypothetical protein [Alicyclobacillus cellulosilyticus]GGJ02162.1 hypothetical protein GCM10010885_09350 [Alicyclobacillus cellulosilyticus]